MNEEETQKLREDMAVSKAQQAELVAQMKENNKVQQETNRSITELTIELRHMLKSHDELNKRVDSHENRIIALEKENYAGQGLKDVWKSVRISVITAIVLAVLASVGLTLK